jgi:hypothetical protein
MDIVLQWTPQSTFLDQLFERLLLQIVRAEYDDRGQYCCDMRAVDWFRNSGFVVVMM